MSGEAHERLLSMVPAFALGALEESERREVEAHLAADCEECLAELRRRSEQLVDLAETLPREPPSETTRRRLMRRVGESARRAAAPTAPALEPPASGRLIRFAAAALVVLVAGLAWLQMGQRRDLARLAGERDATLAEVARLRRDLDGARAELRQTALAHRIVASPGLQAVRLAGLEGAPEASAQTLVDPDQGRAVFYASSLAPAPQGRTYQLWLIADGTPLSAGVFDVDAAGGATLIVDDVPPLASIQAWAVTVEPAGGVPQPTGEMVLKS